MNKKCITELASLKFANKSESIEYFNKLFSDTDRFYFKTPYWYRMINGMGDQLKSIKKEGYVFYWENRGKKYPDLIKQKISFESVNEGR